MAAQSNPSPLLLGVKFTREQYADALKIAPTTARERLRELVQVGKLQVVAPCGSRYSHYMCEFPNLPDELRSMFSNGDAIREYVAADACFLWPAKGFPAWAEDIVLAAQRRFLTGGDHVSND